MATDSHAHGAPHPGAEAGFEPDHPPTGGISGFVVVLLVGIVITLIATVAYIKVTTEYRRVGADPGQVQLRQTLVERDAELAGSYGEVDAGRRVYRLPVSQAMSAVVRDPSLLGALPKLMPDGAATGAEGAD